MTSVTPRADHGESLQAAPLLACVASTWRVSLHRARGWHARTRCEHGDVRSVLAPPEMRERVVQAGLESALLTREEFTAFLDAELKKWGRVIRARNIRLDL